MTKARKAAPKRRKRSKKPPSDETRCKALKTRGGRCERARVRGSEFCFFHGPEGPAREARRKAADWNRQRWQEVRAIAKAYPIHRRRNARSLIVAKLAELDKEGISVIGSFVALMAQLISIFRLEQDRASDGKLVIVLGGQGAQANDGGADPLGLDGPS